MDSNIMISVIIPVYNAEKTIRRAIDSVLCQMHGEVELVLVNDGSKDGSGAICDEYSRNHPEVQVVHKVNGGLATARNAGLAVATGEYITFLDADDYLAANTCEEISKVIRGHHPDCIDFGWSYVNEEGAAAENSHKLQKNVLLGNDILRSLILPPLLHLNDDKDHFIYNFSCMKVYRRQIIEEHSVRFDESRRFWEDRSFVCLYLKYCRNYYSMDQCFYYYVYTEGSLSQQYSPEFFRITLVSFEQNLEVFGDEFDFDTPFVNRYWCGAIENLIYLSLEQTENRDAIRQNIIDTLRNERVIHWYANRQPQDHFEEKVRELVTSGNPEEALRAYEEKAAQKRRQQTDRNFKIRMKRGLQSVLRKITGR